MTNTKQMIPKEVKTLRKRYHEDWVGTSTIAVIVIACTVAVLTLVTILAH